MRVFKTKWFAREARSHAITDEELCRAILETEQGKADALGGGVFKKRLHQNRERAIILAKGEAIGFTRFYMQNRICRTSIVRNWLGFVNLQSIMPS
ncbi:Uncharacterized protein conserved in bacteria [Escherichia coli]|nr:Uncharacterized protein conserved in bacteria [Escherichia coli]